MIGLSVEAKNVHYFVLIIICLIFCSGILCRIGNSAHGQGDGRPGCHVLVDL